MGRVQILRIALILFAGGMLFNSCSDVSFSNSENAVKIKTCEELGTCPPAKYTTYTDNLVAPVPSTKVDVLLVLDNSGSMSKDLDKLALKLDGLVGVLEGGGIDWQMCYITTDGASNARNWVKLDATGKPVNANYFVLKPPKGGAAQIPGGPTTLAELKEVFYTSIDALKDDGSGNEQPIIAIRHTVDQSANANCFRSDAALTTVVISDEDEKSCGGRCQNATSNEHPGGVQSRPGDDYKDQYKALTVEDDPANLIEFINSKLGVAGARKNYVNHSIVIRQNDFICYDSQDTEAPAFFGIEHGRLQSLTGGVLGDICAADYTNTLKVMGQTTLSTVNSMTLKCPPVNNATYPTTVTLNPAPTPMPTYTLTGNKLNFSSPVPPGTTVTVTYTCKE